MSKKSKAQRRMQQRLYGLGFICMAALAVVLIPEEGFAATILAVWGVYCLFAKRIWVK